MSETNNAVETKEENAAAPTGDTTTETVETTDYAAILAEKEAELAKVQEEKENYRKGLLKAKGKIIDDYQPDTDTESEDERIARIVDERLLSTKEAQISLERQAALDAVIKRNKELELALKNRSQIQSTSGGSNEDKPEIKTDNFFSEAQIKFFKDKGWSDEKIETAKKNMQTQP